MGIGIILDLIILFALVGGILWNMRRGFLRALMGTRHVVPGDDVGGAALSRRC